LGGNTERDVDADK